MQGIGILLLDVVLTLFGFFAVAPITLNCISTFGVQKRFADTMIAEGVIDAQQVALLQGKKQTAGVIITVIVWAALAIAAWRAAPYGLICAFVGVVVGLFKYRKVLQFNSLTVQRFQNTYRDLYDVAKLNRYIEKMF